MCQQQQQQRQQQRYGAPMKREAAADSAGGRTVRQRLKDTEERQRGQSLHPAPPPAVSAAAPETAPAAGADQSGIKRGREATNEEEDDRPEGGKRASVDAAAELSQPIGDPEPWMQEPAWMPVWLHKKKTEAPPRVEEQGAAHDAPSASSSSGGARPDTDRSHHMMNVGPMLFCNRCGACGLNRAGAK